MTVIHVDFRDREHCLLVRRVEEQLHYFGFNSMQCLIPEDAIACALDEVTIFASPEKRKAALLKLEDHFQKRRQAETPVSTPLNPDATEALTLP